MLPGAAWGPGVPTTSANASHQAASLRVCDTGSLPRLVQLLHGVECPGGTYSVTLALLGLVEGLVGRGVRAFPLPALVAHALWEVLVPFSRWRFRHRVHRWQVAAAALRLLATALAQPPDALTAALRATLRWVTL